MQYTKYFFIDLVKRQLFCFSNLAGASFRIKMIDPLHETEY